jgi:mannitol-1-phosphate/altronate dehydrogenase
MMIVPKTNNIDNIENQKFYTIQYTKKELDQIQSKFVEQMNKYIARVNNRIIKTLEEIEKETAVVVITGKSSSYKEHDYSF